MGRRSVQKTSRRRSQRLASSPVGSKARRNSLKIDLSSIGEPEESDSHELALPGTHRKRRGRKTKQKNPVVIDLDDSDVVLTGHQRKKRKQNEQTALSEADDTDDSDDDIITRTPLRRGLKRSPVKKSPERPSNKGNDEIPKTPRKYSQQDDLDIEEDLADLRDTGRDALYEM